MVYITETQKKAWEAEIAKLEEYAHDKSDIDGIHFGDSDAFWIGERSGEIKLYKELLSNSVVLPEEESWLKAFDIATTMPEKYPNGVIIKSKQ